MTNKASDEFKPITYGRREDGDFLQTLIDWSRINTIDDICDFKDDEGNQYKRGIPKNKEELLALKELVLHDYQIIDIPDEISSLVNLEVLDIGNNPIIALPDEVFYLPKLNKLYLYGINPSLLSDSQNEKVAELRKNGCFVQIGDDIGM